MDNFTLCTLLLNIYHCHGNNQPYYNDLEAIAYGLDQIPQFKTRLGSLAKYYNRALPKTMDDLRRNITRFFQRHQHLNFGERQAQNLGDVQLITEKFYNWVMMILKRDCQDVARSEKRSRAAGKPDHQIPQSLQTPIAEGITLEDVISSDSMPMSDLIEAEQILENQRKHQEIMAILPEKFACSSKKYPQCNCYEIFQRQYLREPKQTLKEIALELNVAQGTIAGHWSRKCKPLLDELRQSYS